MLEKEDKPRKVFELKLEIWDDGELTSSIVEIVPQDRGAPKKWLLDRTDFIRSLKSQITTTPDLMKDEIVGVLGFAPSVKPSVNDDDVNDDEDFELE